MPKEYLARLTKRTMRVHPQVRVIFVAIVILTTTSFTTLFLQLTTKLSVTVVSLPCLSPLKPQFPSNSPARLLPHEYWEHRRLHPENYKQISCSNIPRLEEIHYAAASWQHLEVSNGNVYVYGAYWDNRFNEPWVRILVYCDVVPFPPLMCSIWFEDENAPVTVPSNITYLGDNWDGPEDGVNELYVMSCRARRHPPDEQRSPAAVSVVREELLCGTPTNVLSVQGVPLSNAPRPPLNSSTISVCLNSLLSQDVVAQELVEWIELIKAFGADKLFVFEVESHPLTKRVIDHYAAIGFVDVSEFAHPPQSRSVLPPSEENVYELRKNLLPMYDCLYRSLHRYQWMTLIEKDQMIVPRRNITWKEVLAAVVKDVKDVDTISLRNYHFMDSVQWDIIAPPYMKKLGHLWRAKKPIGYNVKSFYNTASLVVITNSSSCEVSRGSDCPSRDRNTSTARLHHYRRRCDKTKYNCRALHDIEKDYTMSNWKHLIKKVDNVLSKLGMKPKVDSWFWN